MVAREVTRPTDARTDARTDASQLASPAVIAVEQIPGAQQLLFAGEIVDPDSTPVNNAILHVWGIELRAEAHGRFELLAYGPRSGPIPIPIPIPIPVTIAAPGHAAVDIQIVVEANTPRLSDGTLVLLQTFVLGGE
jgi:hypothetical protein